MAIQDGLRFLWYSQVDRVGGFPASTTTYWSDTGYTYADTSLVVLAFENQGYKLVGNVAPTGIFEKYVIRRGLNYVLSQLQTLAIGVTPQGDNSCVIYDCVGLRPPFDNQGYTTALAALGFAGSGALTRINTEVAGYTNGKTFGEILQRLVNALAWGQEDNCCISRGGWYYTFNSGGSDGSTVGWDILALLDAASAGATVPAFVKTEFVFALNNMLNNDGTFDYRSTLTPPLVTSPARLRTASVFRACS